MSTRLGLYGGPRAARQSATQFQQALSGSMTPTGTVLTAFTAVQAVTGVLTGLAGALASLFIPSAPSLAGAKIRGMLGRMMGRR